MSNQTRLCRARGDGLIRITGRDARRFLQAQTTQRIDDLPADTTRLAAWLTAKGRVRALFDIVPDGEAFWLLLPADIAASVATGLGRYVLRDQLTIEQPADRIRLTALGAIDAWLEPQGIRLAPGGVTMTDAGLLARTGPERVELIVAGMPAAIATSAAAVDSSSGSDAGAGAVSASAAAPESRLLAGLAPADPAVAELDAIARGRPSVSGVLVERYIPQMLDLDRLNAISFNKGCYPGQEIVARTHNLGEVKRRLGRFAAAAGPVPAAGDGIVDAGGADCGEINRAAATGDGNELLAVVTLAADPTALRLAADGRALTPLALPWSA